MTKRLNIFSLLLLVMFAEIQRVCQEKLTYRTQLVLGVLTGFVGLAQFAILGYYISLGGTPPGLDEYGDSVIAFMIIGSLFTAIALMMMNSLKMQIQSEQQRGTLEAIALSGAGIFRFLVAGSVFGILSSLSSSVVIFTAFAVIFDFELNVNFFGLGIAIVSAALCMWLIGLCAASYILVSKQGEPVTWVVTTLLALFSGVMYPITVFPDSIVNALQYLPTVGMLHGIRIALFSGASSMDVITALTPTLFTIAIFLPLSSIFWKHGLQRARCNGTLGTY